MTEEKLAEIEALLESEPDYHCVMVGYEPHPAWALDVKAVRELVTIARREVQRQMIAEEMYELICQPMENK
jgi:hypothetical protein